MSKYINSNLKISDVANNDDVLIIEPHFKTNEMYINREDAVEIINHLAEVFQIHGDDVLLRKC